MRMTTPLLGAAVGGAIGMLKRDPAKYALWGAGIGLIITFMGGAAVSIGGVSIRVGVDDALGVKGAQMALRQLGYNVELDGVLGPRTAAAIRSVQARCGLPQDGKPTDATLECISRLLTLPPGPIATSGQPGPVISGWGDWAGCC